MFNVMDNDFVLGIFEANMSWYISVFYNTGTRAVKWSLLYTHFTIVLLFLTVNHMHSHFNYIANLK